MAAASLAAHFEQVDDLSGTDEEIEAAVQEAELPPLLAALYALTGDEELVGDDLVPPLPQLGAAGFPHGGMSPVALARGRALAASALIRARDEGWSRDGATSELIRRSFTYLSSRHSEDLAEMLTYEFGGLAGDDAREWTKEDIAPDRDFKVLVIGGGLAGIAAAYRLSQHNVPFTVLEKSSGPGGVWHDNRYPGCRLDTPNFAYGFSFAPKPDWPQEFSQQEEILRYLHEVVDSAEISENFQFGAEVLRMEYDIDRSGWSVTAHRHGRTETYFADVVISAVGHLNRPRVPEIPGQGDYLGRAFHSAEWPDDADIDDKRVAVVGTGASGFQVVPSIASRVKELTVFQRTASWILSTPNYNADIRQGMQKLLRSVPYFGRWERLWQYILAVDARYPLVGVDPNWRHPISVSAPNERLRQECLQLLAEQCGDRDDLREKLTPGYPPGAKRMVRDDGSYVRALKQPNVRLVSDRITELTPTGITTADGEHHEVDVVVYATGFHATSYMAPIDVVGKEGVSLHDFWDGDSRAYLGLTVPGYPNLFIVGGPNSGLVVNGNAVVTTEYSLNYVLSGIEYVLREQIASTDVRTDAYESYNRDIDAENRMKAWGVATVNTWYQGKGGRPAVPWPYPIREFFRRTVRFDPDAYEARPVGSHA